jgi:hypothetical protein
MGRWDKRTVHFCIWQWSLKCWLASVLLNKSAFPSIFSLKFCFTEANTLDNFYQSSPFLLSNLLTTNDPKKSDKWVISKVQENIFRYLRYSSIPKLIYINIKLKKRSTKLILLDKTQLLNSVIRHDRVPPS